MNNKIPNLFQCWDCRMKGVPCYCNQKRRLKESLKVINKEVLK